MTTQTKQTDTAQGNRLIAEFMGLTPESELDNRYFDTPDRYYKYDTGEYRITNTATPEDMQYNASWSWLMPVIDRIEQIGATVIIGRMFCEIKYIDPFNQDKQFDIRIASGVKMNAINGAVTEFIKWYNEQNQ